MNIALVEMAGLLVGVGLGLLVDRDLIRGGSRKPASTELKDAKAEILRLRTQVADLIGR